MSGKIDFELSLHAATVMSERRIREEWVVRVLRRPERIESDSADASLHHAFGRIAERGDRVLRVIYNHSATPWRIVTVYFDRAARGKP